MKVALFGPRGSGKTTLFNALTGSDLPAGTPTLEAHAATIPVPDPRIDRLAEIHKPKKVVYAKFDLVDVPGFGRERDRKTDNRILEALRDADLVCLTLGMFDFDRMLDERGPDPARDFAELMGEMCLLDLIGVEAKLERLAKQKRTSDMEQEQRIMLRLKEALEAGRSAADAGLAADEAKRVSGYNFLTLKRFMVAVNVAERFVGKEAEALAALAGKLPPGVEAVAVCAAVEAEVAKLPAEERAEFLASLGVAEPARDLLIRTAYRLLDRISFLTAGPDECRAWTVGRGTIARAAAGAIHSDLERGFIRAEVIAYDEFARHGSEAAAKAAKAYRLEGATYTVQDGDIIEIRFNV